MRRNVVRRVCAATFVAATGFPLAASSQIQEKIEVISLSKRSTANDTDTGLRSLCAKWMLTAADVEYFFRHAHPISGEEHHALYDVFPCGYSGTLVMGGQRLKFEINAGSSGELGDTLYGCLRECADLFETWSH